LDPVHFKEGLLNRNCYKSLSGAQNFKTMNNFSIFVTYETSDNICRYQLLRNMSRNEKYVAYEAQICLTGKTNLQESICCLLISIIKHYLICALHKI